MFEEPRQLIVVYKKKDEIPLNQLKKLVDTKDDNKETQTIVGTEDGTVKIIAWNEKTWIDNKKAGNTGKMDDKVLFLGNIKGVENLIPTLDIKFNKYGVSYGFSGKQAVISVNPNALGKKENYDNFIADLQEVCNATTVEERKKYSSFDKKNAAKNVAEKIWETLAYGLDGALAKFTVDALNDKKIVRNQQFLFGVSKLYYDDLDSFMKS